MRLVFEHIHRNLEVACSSVTSSANNSEPLGKVMGAVAAFEQTPAFRIAALHSRLNACDELLTRAEALERLESELDQSRQDLLNLEREVDEEQKQEREKLRELLSGAQEDCEKAKKERSEASAKLEAAEKRLELLGEGVFSKEDDEFITREVDGATSAVAEERNQAQAKLRVQERAKQELADKLRSLREDLAQAKKDLNGFSDCEVPGTYAQRHKETLQKAENALDAEAGKVKESVAASEKEAEETRATIARLGKQIEECKTKETELARISQQGIFSKLGSSIWWGALGTDYPKRRVTAASQQEKHKQELPALEKRIQQLRRKRDKLAKEREGRLHDAAVASATKLKATCQEKVDHLPEEIASLQKDVKRESNWIYTTKKKIERLEKDLGRIASEARKRVIGSLTAEAEAQLEKADEEFRAQQEKTSQREAALDELNESLSSFESRSGAVKADRLRPAGERATGAKSEFDRVSQELRVSMAQSGIACSGEDFRRDIETARDEAATEIGNMAAKSKNERPDWQTTAGTDSMDPGSAENQVNMAETQEATGNLYIDFSRNEDDHQDSKGRTFPGLRRQFEELCARHRSASFRGPDVSGDSFVALVDALFPEGVTQSYFVCNLSLTDRPFLSFRPRIVGPRLESLIPRGMSLAICGRLSDSQRDQDNPIFLAQRLVDISESPARPFERGVTGVVYTQPQHIYPAIRRQQNVLNTDFIQQLPAISAETRSRLDDWRAYLDWKEQLVHARLLGLRYLQVTVVNDGRVRFLTASPSQQDFEQTRRTLRNNELYAYSLNYSQDPWEFEYNDRHRGRGAELGDFDDYETVQQPQGVDEEDMPWDDPYYVYVYFRLPEEAQNEFDENLDAGQAPEQAANRYLQTVSPDGFLSLSVVGDIALVRRQRTELQQLQEQSGFAPFLSSYLFDISAANEPSELVEIEDEHWSQPRLNEDQKKAVRKMVSTPDLAMVQGPPGTGKTTMIAEAAWQFSRQGKKVLVVSQASLAVNNALERLPQIPSIRAIRLSRRERSSERDHPFSQTQALRTYYNSIARACSERTLNVWTEAEERRGALAKCLVDLELVAADLGSLRSKCDDLRADADKHRKELSKLKKQRENAENLDQRRNDLRSIQRFLDGGESFTGSLPEAIADEIYRQLITVWNGLREIDIQINEFWSSEKYGSLEERSRFFREAVLRWRTVLSLRDQLAGDIARIASSEGDTVMSPELATQLADLQRQLDKTQKAMIDDASKVTEWQAIQRNMQELKRSDSGLSRDIYARLFNVPDNASLELVTKQTSSKSDVLAALQKALDAIDHTASQVTNAIPGIRGMLDEAASAIEVPTVDKDLSHRLQGDLRQLEERIKETARSVKDKEKRMAGLLKACPIPIPQNTDGGNIDADSVLEYLRSELNGLEMKIGQSQSFRDAWQGLLTEWVRDLQSEETIRCDQDNFFDTYVSACNVVGVTCTESKRTLEDAGHTWFDAVIVDEVSKATPTEIIMPLMMGRTAILVGDHRQLPPLFKEHEGSYEEVIADLEERDEDDRDASSELTAENFERFRKMVTSSLFKEHFENAPESLKSFLFTQYRMHPQIMRVVNQFYENRLGCGLEDPDGEKDGADPESHRLHGLTLPSQNSHPYIIPDRHVAWLDSTVDPNSRKHHERRDLGSSKVNELECILIAKALCDIERSCRDQGFGANGRPRKQVGVVTFYGRQVRAIREAIRRAQKLYNIRFNAIDYDVNTVDRYQGQERPILLVSLVRNPPFRLSRRANTAQFERINVAFSRAQELLIIAGAKDVFCKYPVQLPHLDRPGKRKVEVYRYIIDEIHRNGGFWPSGEIISPADYKSLLPRGFNTSRGGKRTQTKARPNHGGRRHR